MKVLLSELLGQEEKLLNCVHCGFCLPACPTYSRLGDEADSPRGRLHLMRAVVEGRLSPDSGAFFRHLDRCLGCRACESVCPSGVEYGHLLEGAREVLSRTHRRGILDRILSRVMVSPPLLAFSMFLTRILRATGIPALAALRLPSKGLLGQARLGLGMVAATGPPQHLIEAPGRDGPSEFEMALDPPAETLGRGRVTAVLLGCVQEGLLARVNRATIRVLEVNGFRVVKLQGLGCCGAIHAHTGDLEGARELARKNIRAMDDSEFEMLAVNAAGCGATIKDYGHLLAEDEAYGPRAAHLSSITRDVTELLGRDGLLRGAPLPLSVTYDSPCHLLHAQKITEEPLFLLGAIPELRLIPLEKHDECCGGAGVYGITHPGLGGTIGGDKIAAVKKTGASVVSTGNPGCMMQIGAGLRMDGQAIDVVHPVELLDESYRRAGFYRRGNERI